MWFLPSQVSAHGFNQLRIMHVILQYAFSERNSCVNRPAQFRPVLFKGQLYFSKEHWFLLLGSGIRNQDLCTRCPPCYYGIFASLPIQWTELGKTCIHVHINIHMCTYMHISLYVHSLQIMKNHSETCNSSSSLQSSSLPSSSPCLYLPSILKTLAPNRDSVLMCPSVQGLQVM